MAFFKCGLNWLTQTALKNMTKGLRKYVSVCNIYNEKRFCLLNARIPGNEYFTVT